MDISKKIKNPELYRKVREEIKKEYPKHSAYRSMMIITEYKKRGGIMDEKLEKKSGLKRWLDEKWINVYEYLKNDKIIACGDKSALKHSACRPLKRINKDTPITLPELLKIHSKQDILKAIELKNKDPQGYIMRWETLKAIKKKK